MRPAPNRCAGCGRLAPAHRPICGICLGRLEHVCYGKTRQYKRTAKAIEAREQTIPGREMALAYACPVCGEWHTGMTSLPGEACYADAVLICLKLSRFHADYLAGLAAAWTPELADRRAWRLAASPHRFAPREVSDDDRDPRPAEARSA